MSKLTTARFRELAEGYLPVLFGESDLAEAG